jgi:hypothetical protein
MDNFIHEDELDRRLRDAAPYIDDAEFSQRVLKQLPPRRSPQRLRGAILVLVTAVASVLTYIISGGGRFVTDAFLQLTNLSMVWLLVVTFAAGLLLTVGGLAAALLKNKETSF